MLKYWSVVVRSHGDKVPLYMGGLGFKEFLVLCEKILFLIKYLVDKRQSTSLYSFRLTRAVSLYMSTDLSIHVRKSSS